MQITVRSSTKREIIDITDTVQSNISGDGLVHVFIAHTTAAITTADLDPGTDADYLAALNRLTPSGDWNHPHDPAHFPGHLWASLIGPDVTVPVRDGRLILGTWQRIIMIELDGPRERTLHLTMLH